MLVSDDEAGIPSALAEGSFNEVTYNGDEKELYLDMYSKYTKQTIDLKWDEVYS